MKTRRPTRPTAPRSSPTTDALMAAYDVVLFDLAGTVYHGAQGIPGVPETVETVRAHGTAVRFVTNNASKAPEEVVRHLVGLGIPAEADEIHTSAQAGVAVLKDRLDPGAEVLVVGTESLAAEVTQAGLKPVRENAESVQAVVQGHSPDNTWAALAEACLAIRAGALWVAANVDATLPTERGLLPGNGAMVAALRSATDAEPQVAGKPAPILLLDALKRGDFQTPLVVGDRLNTDIAGANSAELPSLMVLTGVNSARDAVYAVPDQRATFIGRDLRALQQDADEL